MSDLSSKTTIYLNPKVKKFIQHRAVEEDRSVSDVINDQFSEILEDFDDIKTIRERRGEPAISFSKVLEELDLTYADLHN